MNEKTRGLINKRLMSKEKKKTFQEKEKKRKEKI